MSIIAIQLNAQHPGLNVRVEGKGQPIVMIPGLTCSGDVWDSTVEAMGKGYEYHIITLPGFAGNAPIPNHEDKYLEKMRDEVIAYIDKQKLEKPIVIGHSLGGFLALNIAIKKPELTSKLVIVDALPFMTAIQMPTMTAESAKGFAGSMKHQIVNAASQPIENRKAYQRTMLRSMIIDSTQIELATQWSIDSDQETVGQAMYEMYTTDIRPELGKINVPVLVLGAYIAYKDYGATRASVMKSYTEQYANLNGATIDLTDKGNHFIMWDDPEFFLNWLEKFL